MEDMTTGNLEWADDKKDKVMFVRKVDGGVNMYDGSKINAAKLDELALYASSHDPYLMLDNGVKYPKGLWHNDIDYGKVTKRMLGLHQGLNITWFGNHMAFWLSIVKAKNAIFSRRYGIKGKIIFGYSIRLRILSKDII